MYRPNQPPPYKDINVSLLAPQNFPNPVALQTITFALTGTLSA